MRSLTKTNIIKKARLAIWPFILGGCSLSYAKPITQERAARILSDSLSVMLEDQFAYKKIRLESEIKEKEIVSALNTLSLKQEGQYIFEYVSEPFSLSVDVTGANHFGRKNIFENAHYAFTKENGEYLVSVNGASRVMASEENCHELYKVLNFPRFLKGTGVFLLQDARRLLDLVGQNNDGKTNNLEGFQPSSRGGSNLNIEFLGKNFNVRQAFFDKAYRGETALSYSLSIDENLVRKYSSTYSFTVETENEQYEVGTYRGTVTNRIFYET